MSESEPEKFVLHVEGLTRNVTTAHVTEIFGTYGNVLNATVKLDDRTRLSQGVCDIEFESRENALHAQLYMDGAQIDGQKIKASFVLINKDQYRRTRGRHYRDRSRSRGQKDSSGHRRSPSPLQRNHLGLSRSRSRSRGRERGRRSSRSSSWSSYSSCSSRSSSSLSSRGSKRRLRR